MKSCCNKKHEEIRSPLGKARGLGSSKSGFAHWWSQRITALALIPLSIWLLINIQYMFATSHVQATTWLGQPMNAVGVILFIWLSFYHALLGIEVVIQDYVPKKSSKTIGLLFARFFFVLLGFMSAYAVLQTNFGVDNISFVLDDMHDFPISSK